MPIAAGLLALSFALVPVAVRAATGTLDTGSLTPQASASREAAEIANTGASARTQGGEEPPPPSIEATPREPGQNSAGPAGRGRPMQ